MSRIVVSVFLALVFLSVPALAGKPPVPASIVGTWVYVPENPFDPTPSDFRAALKTSSKAINLTAAPEEWECGTFYACPPRDLGVITAVPTDLAMGKAVITRDNVEVWTVHNMPINAPETEKARSIKLLVKTEPCVPSLYGAKTIGDAAAEFKQGAVKQMWVRVYVPKRTKPGAYYGSVVLTSSVGGPWKVPLQVDVRPMRLLLPSKKYGLLNYNYPNPVTDETVSPQPAVPTSRPVSQATFVALLKDLKAHGLILASISDQVSNLFDALKIYEDNGMAAPALYMGLGAWDDPPDEEKIKTIERERKELGLPEILYSPSSYPIACSDQLDPIKQQLVEITRKAWVKSSALLADEEAAAALGEYVSVPIYAIDSPRVRGICNGEAKRAADRCEYYYWDAANADLMTNRLNAGMLLWKSGLDGAYLISEPPDAHPGQTIGYGGPARLIYLGKATVIDSLNMEAVREGIDDVRYITTMMNALREAKDLKRVPELTNAAESYLKSFLSKPPEKITYADLQAFRGKMASYAIKIRQAVPEK